MHPARIFCCSIGPGQLMRSPLIRVQEKSRKILPNQAGNPFIWTAGHKVTLQGQVMRLLSNFTPVLQRLRETLDYLPAIGVVFLILKQSPFSARRRLQDLDAKGGPRRWAGDGGGGGWGVERCCSAEGGVTTPPCDITDCPRSSMLEFEDRGWGAGLFPSPHTLLWRCGQVHGLPVWMRTMRCTG